MQQEKKTKPCPYKCMRCPDEGHPELDSEPEQEEVFRAKWEITSSEEEDFIAKPVPKEGPKKANDKKKFYQAQARREPDLDVDSIHFAHLGGFSSVDPMKGKRDNKPKILTRPKVPASKNNVDFSKPLDHWMKKETIKEVYGFIREHAKNKKGIPTDEDLD